MKFVKLNYKEVYDTKNYLYEITNLATDANYNQQLKLTFALG
jgi:hypothetical protein